NVKLWPGASVVVTEFTFGSEQSLFRQTWLLQLLSGRSFCVRVTVTSTGADFRLVTVELNVATFPDATVWSNWLVDVTLIAPPACELNPWLRPCRIGP